MCVLIFANGELEPGQWVQTYLDRATVLIAADGGIRHVRSLGLWPSVVIGDLDSTTAELKLDVEEAGIETVSYPEMKDETDLELALKYALENFEGEIIVLGALGGRLDQLLANVFLLTAPFLNGRKVKVAAAFQEAWIIGKGNDRIEGKVGDIVSLLPLDGDVQIERTTGLEWPLLDEALVKGMSRGISNRMTAAIATVQVSSGSLLCIHLAEEWRR